MSDILRRRGGPLDPLGTPPVRRRTRAQAREQDEKLAELDMAFEREQLAITYRAALEIHERNLAAVVTDREIQLRGHLAESSFRAARRVDERRVAESRYVDERVAIEMSRIELGLLHSNRQAVEDFGQRGL